MGISFTSNYRRGRMRNESNPKCGFRDETTFVVAPTTAHGRLTTLPATSCTPNHTPGIPGPMIVHRSRSANPTVDSKKLYEVPGFPAPLPTKAALAMVLALIMLLVQTLLHAGAGNTFAAGADQNNQLILFEPDAIEILVSFEHRGPHIEGVGPQFTFNPRSNLLYLRFHPHDNHVTDISLSTEEIRYRDFTELPSFVNQMQVHPATDELYFWDDSIGRVFVLPPNDTLRRIDNSFKHKNQYGHTGWLDNQGRIHAFGGYGLFSFKSIIIRFSPATGEWFLLQVEDETDMPAPQTSAVVVPDLARQEAYIFGMNRLQRDVPRYLRFESAPRNGAWKFHTVLNRWSYLGTLPYELDRDQQVILSMHPDGDFMLLPVSISESQRDVIAWFPETGAYVRLTDLNVRVRDYDNLLGIFWSEADEAYYLFYIQYAYNTMSLNLLLHRITIPDAAAFTKAYGQAGSAPAGYVRTDDGRREVAGYLLVALFLGALVVGGFVILLRRRRRRAGRDQAHEVSNKGSNLAYAASNTGSIEATGGPNDMNAYGGETIAFGGGGTNSGDFKDTSGLTGFKGSIGNSEGTQGLRYARGGFQSDVDGFPSEGDNHQPNNLHSDNRQNGDEYFADSYPGQAQTDFGDENGDSGYDFSNEDPAGSPVLYIEVDRSTGAVVLSTPGGSRTEVQNPWEKRLLELMARDFAADSKLYTGTDEIDEVLIPNHPSYDYLRRVRNITLERLAGLLRQASGVSTNEMFILRRKSPTDKRKFEFRLNARLVSLK
jgi:hypothetical protein